MTQNTQPPTGFEVKLEYSVLLFHYMFCPVFVVINGSTIKAAWGVQFFPAVPGRYRIECYTSYLITPLAGLNSVEIDLQPGQVFRIQWNAPPIVFMKGKMRTELIADAYGQGNRNTSG